MIFSATSLQESSMNCSLFLYFKIAVSAIFSRSATKASSAFAAAISDPSL